MQKKDIVMNIKPRRLEHQNELQHLPWPNKSPDLNIFKLIQAVLERRIKQSLKQLADVLIDNIQLIQSCVNLL